jgi:ethanolamine-phosphate phospho-lyase
MAGMKESLIAERAQVIGPNCALNYAKNPIVVLRGEKQWLYDEFGVAYLDCVNNVCHVGHCHPDVVKAASTQLATLQTNSR